AGAPAPAPPPTQLPFLTAPNVARSDMPALARSQLRALREQARAAATIAPNALIRAHWQDIADRADNILEPRRTR
ncbi:MAG TPA: hypothetical protein VGQ52_17500, partial [Gemmatimonadaceae bacterium]|nr:hypothetical protein [Gemmatimonadaceae bacterium]